jgi:hypothetical protein
MKQDNEKKVNFPSNVRVQHNVSLVIAAIERSRSRKLLFGIQNSSKDKCETLCLDMFLE